MAQKSKNLKLKANKAVGLITFLGIVGALGFLLRWPVIADQVAKAIGKPEMSGTISNYADAATGLSVAVTLLYFAFLVASNPVAALLLAILGIITAFFTLKKLF